jgi:hypothetical protein
LANTLHQQNIQADSIYGEEQNKSDNGRKQLYEGKLALQSRRTFQSTRPTCKQGRFLLHKVLNKGGKAIFSLVCGSKDKRASK